MIISEMRTMRGPNMWSQEYQHIIAAKFNLAELTPIALEREEAIKQYFKEVYNAEPQGSHIAECIYSYVLMIAAALQGNDLFRELRYPAPGVVYGLVEYTTAESGIEAVTLAGLIVEAVIKDELPIPFPLAYQKIQEVIRKTGEGPSTSAILNAARKRNIPVSQGPAGYAMLGYGKNQKRLSAAISQYTTCIAVNIAGDKQDTKAFLKQAMIPVPEGTMLREEDDLFLASERLGFPLVTKPLNGNQGKNITGGINDLETLLTGFRLAKENSRNVIIEKEISGKDYRLLVIGNKFVAASLRRPAFVTGDGRSTVTQLVEKENADPRRGKGHANILTQITMDAASEQLLYKQGLCSSAVPMAGREVFLKTTANLSTGGTAEDVTESVHPENIKLAEKVAQVIGLDICGIDIMSADISIPLTKNGGAVIEVNAAPGLRMHLYPSEGAPRNVADPIVDLMFTKNDEGRIPIVAITGTNGKTTTTRLMAHVAGYAGFSTGFTTTDGIYIDNVQVKRGDCSGPQSAKTILQDPTIDFAVLECARGGIIRSGLAFDQCDIAIVTNVAADHLGLKDIYTVQDLADLKSTVPCSVKKGGWAILNAGDEHVYAMRKKVKANVALFSTDENNPYILQHLDAHGFACVMDAGLNIYLCSGDQRIHIINATEIPITRGGKALFMIENVLPVILAAYFSDIAAEHIADALRDFIPSTEQTPGRINEFSINGVNVIVDYAHNPHGLKALSGYLKNIPEKKTGIITGTGDRRDEDIIEFGRIAADMYDEVIIRFDRDTRGRSYESITELLMKGMRQIKPQITAQVIPDTKTAIAFAVAHAAKNSYVVICADDAIHTVNLTKEIASAYQH